jgi:hypothetical protein
MNEKINAHVSFRGRANFTLANGCNAATTSAKTSAFIIIAVET